MPDDLEEPGAGDAPGRGHEPEGIDVRGVIAGGGGIVLLLLVVCAVMYGVYWWFARRKPESPSPASLVRGAPQIAGPKLNPDQPDELRALREAEDKRLSSYGWVDKSGGVARIPIDRAVDILAEKGFGVQGSGFRTPLPAPPPSLGRKRLER